LLFGLGVVAVTWKVGNWLWAAPYRAQSLDARRVESPRRVSASTLAAPKTAESPAAAPPVAPSASASLVKAVVSRASPFANTRNFLLIGLDRRADGGGPALADTLVIVVLNEKAGQIGLVSVPRDTYVEIPDVGFDRINTVYNVARRAKTEPLALLSRVVSDTVGLPIEHALAIDLGLFERAIDALGGVDVQVPCSISDRFLDSRASGGRRLLDVSEGLQRMDGATAAMYVRSRHGRSDWNRARRQQAVLLGVRHELETLGGLAKLPSLWDELEASVQTDLRRVELLALARRAFAVEPSHLHGLVLGAAEMHGEMTSDGRAVLIPDPSAIERALAGLFSAPSPGAALPGAKCAPKDAALRARAGS
jgi:LCP family protein required for cell wall assembly